MCVLHSGPREADKYFQDRMQRYPDCWESVSGLSRRAALQRQRRIDQSIVFELNLKKDINADTMTHKNEDPISIFLPPLSHLVIFFLCGLGVHGEERP